MANLLQNDRNMIAAHPSNGALDCLRDALDGVEQSYKRNPTPNKPDDQGPRTTISRLLAAFLGHKVAFELQLRTRNDAVTSELATIIGRIYRDNFAINHLRNWL